MMSEKKRVIVSPFDQTLFEGKLPLNVLPVINIGNR